jgi:hypothetical protein
VSIDRFEVQTLDPLYFLYLKRDALWGQTSLHTTERYLGCN